MAVENGWGQGAVNNSNDYGKAKANSTNGFGKIYETTNAGLTNIEGGQPVVSISYASNSFCADASDPTPTVSNNAGAGTFSSTTGLVFISTSTGQVDISASTVGSYVITYTDTDAATATFNLTINALPTVIVSASAGTICNGETTTLTATGASTYVWSNGSTGNSITVSPTTTTLFTATGTDSNGCTSSGGTTITVNALPTVEISGTLTYCAGSTTTLTATAGLSSYLWSTGATTQSINVTAGSYTVTGTDSNGCSATSSASTVTELPLDTATVTYSASAYCQMPTGALAVDGYYPLYTTESAAQAESSDGTAHSHTLSGTTYYMPNDGVIIYHGTYSLTTPAPTITGESGTFSESTGNLSIDSSTGVINVNNSTAGTYTVVYTTNGSCPNTVNNTITVNALDGATFAYSSNSLPQTGTASLTTTPTTSGGVFSAYPSGLSINSSTGEIDLANSTIQSYKIFYETSGAGCPNSSTFDLAVTAAFSPLKFKVNIQTTTTTSNLDFKIPFVNGTNFTINWGDSNIDTNLSVTNSSITHRYNTAGVYTIEVGANNSYPTRLAFCGFGGNPNTIADNGALAVTEITQWGSIPWSYVESMWDGCTNLDIMSATDTPDFSNLLAHPYGESGLTRFLGGSTNTAWQAMRGPSLTTVNASINTWDVSSVKNFSGCFGGGGSTSAFNANINNWDISGITEVAGLANMFNGCLRFNQSLSNWTLPSTVTSLSGFLQGAEDFNQDISHFNMTNITNISKMFHGCDDFDATNLENWERTTPGNASTMANVVNMSELFNYKKDVNKTFNNAISSWNTSGVTNMRNLVANVTGNGNGMTATFVTGWDTSSVSDFTAAFKNTYDFNSNLGSLDISSLTSGSQMFFTWASGQSTANYTDTLVGWANFVYNNSGPYTVNFGNQSGRTFDRSRSGGANFADAGAARDYLTGATANWSITSDTEIN